LLPEEEEEKEKKGEDGEGSAWRKDI